MGRDSQIDQFSALGANRGEIEELLAYNEIAFDLETTDSPLGLPLDDEPFVACWQTWADEARGPGVWATLAARLPQLRFPIRAGISTSEGYVAATRRGVAVDDLPEATGLALERPAELRLEIHPTPAGRIPLLITGHRADFVALVRALARRNEPSPVPESMGALAVAGYNNWQRLRALQQGSAVPFAELRERRELYQDRFILLSDGPYSGVSVAELGLEESAWRASSLVLRREHECAHYFTRRVLGSMRNHLHDELIADDAGIRAVAGRFRADWFLRFLGIAGSGQVCSGAARLEIYRGTPPLSDGAWAIERELLTRAARHLERFDLDGEGLSGVRGPAERAVRIGALASLGLATLANDDGADRLAQRLVELRGLWSASKPRLSGPRI